MNRFNKKMVGNNYFLLFFMCVFIVSCASKPETSTIAKPIDEGIPDRVRPDITEANGAERAELIRAGIPPAALALLKKREGFKETVYTGENGRLTAGVGHVLTAEEKSIYLLGAIVPEVITEQWLIADTQESWIAAVDQALDAGDKRLAEPLFAVNYQLGIYWYREHPKTYAMLKSGDWSGTVNEFMTSGWCRQTPLRCEDFKQALLAL